MATVNDPMKLVGTAQPQVAIDTTRGASSPQVGITASLAIDQQYSMARADLDANLLQAVMMQRIPRLRARGRALERAIRDADRREAYLIVSSGVRDLPPALLGTFGAGPSGLVGHSILPVRGRIFLDDAERPLSVSAYTVTTGNAEETLDADGAVEDTAEESVSLDGIISATDSEWKVGVGGALVVEGEEETLDADGAVSVPLEEALDADGAVEAERTIPASFSAYVEGEEEEPLGCDGFVLAPSEEALDADGAVERRGSTARTSFDGAVRVSGRARLLNFDGLLAVSRSVPTTVRGIVQGTSYSLSLAADGVVAVRDVLALSFDGHVDPGV